MAAGISVLAVDGLTVTVERKAIRNLYLRVRSDGSVLLTAPRSVSDGRLTAFIRQKRAWLDKRLAAPAAYVPRFVSGERFPVWGVWYPLRTAESAGRASAALQAGALCLCAPAAGGPEARKAAVDAFYRRELTAALPAVVLRQEAAAGLHAASWQIRDMSTRWGSCTIRTGAIRVNLHLARFPPECLRYLVTHELTHLLEPGHNPRFYGFLDQFDPGWREARACLRAGAPVLPPENEKE